MNTNKAVIAGGAGFIGRHLVERLKQEGWEVVVVDTKEGMDMADPKLTELLQKERPAVVFHLAGPIQLRYPEQGEDPFDICASLVAGTKNLLDVARVSGVAKIIFSSSAAVYGAPQNVPTPESNPAQPVHLYGIMTFLLEHLLQAQSTTPIITLRFSNVYGPGQRDQGPIIPSFIKAMKSNAKPIIVGNKGDTLDFLYVEDAVEAFWKAANFAGTGVFNVGSGYEKTKEQAYESIAALLGWSGGYTIEMPQPPKRSALDALKAKKELAWEPRVSFEQGIRKTIQAAA